MFRLARLDISGTPHHVPQRGNRHAQTFFEDGLRCTYADAQRYYTGYINARMRVTGH